jgi:hypothetical protein
MCLSGPIAHVFSGTATDAQRDAGWAAARLLFAALRRDDVTEHVEGHVVDCEGLLAWAAAGFTRRQRREWSDWMDAPARAAEYRLAGFTPQEASRWSGVYGAVPADIALAFRAAGWRWEDLGPMSLTLGRNAPVSDLVAWLNVPAAPDVVALAAQAGVGVEEAAVLARQGRLDRDGLSLLRALKKDRRDVTLTEWVA